MKYFPFLFALAAITMTSTAASSVVVGALQCEHQTNPKAVATTTPMLAWQLSGPEKGLRQSAYQVLAASSAELLAAGKGDLWESGEVQSFWSQNVPLRAEALKPDQQVHWKVRVKDQASEWSAWSAPATFTFKPDASPPNPLPLFRKGAPRISSFESSDESLNKLFDTAPARLAEITTLRDTYLSIRAACFHHDLFPHAADWLNLLNASATDRDFYPGSLPPKTAPGSLNSDAGILSTHVLWLMSGDRSLLDDNWKTMHKYLTARKKIDPKFTGRPFGSLPDGTIPDGDNTPPELIHTASQGLLYRIMSELSRTASDTPFETPILEGGYKNLRESYQKRYLGKDDKLTVDSTLAQLVTLRFGLLSTPEQKSAVSQQFFEKFKTRPQSEAFSDGPLAAYSLLPVLTWTDHHDLALETVKKQSPDKLSPVAHAAISEWLIWMVAGIDALAPGFQHTRFAPFVPEREVLSFAKASYESPYGTVSSHWRHEDDGFHYEIVLAPNTFGTVVLPAGKDAKVTLGGKALDGIPEIVEKKQEEKTLTLSVLPGNYHFHVAAP